MAREEAGLKQVDLADRIGLKRTSVTNIEAGRQQIQLHTLWQIADALGVTVGALLPSPEAVAAPDIERRLKGYQPAEQEWVRRVVAKPTSQQE
jgi:transcriptional regulator with XRE-family HTH domain